MEEKTYAVYVHKVVDDERGPLWYVGVTCNLKNRWIPSAYKKNNNSLKQYIEIYGWDNIEHRIVADGLDRETALKLEDCLILMYRSTDCCINRRRSGYIKAKDRKLYCKEWKKENTGKVKTYNKQYHNSFYSTTEGKIYNRVHNFNKTHKDRIIETPLEAKQKYLATGYIPDYIKNDDLT